MENYWLWVNSGKMDVGDDLEKDYKSTWYGCHKDTKKSDKVLIYRVNPHKHIKYLAEIIEDCEQDLIRTDMGTKEGYKCQFKILESFDDPLEISDMRKTPLEDWYPLKLSFRRMVFPIDEKYWLELKEIITRKKRNHETIDSF